MGSLLEVAFCGWTLDPHVRACSLCPQREKENWLPEPRDVKQLEEVRARESLRWQEQQQQRQPVLLQGPQQQQQPRGWQQQVQAQQPVQGVLQCASNLGWQQQQQGQQQQERQQPSPPGPPCLLGKQAPAGYLVQAGQGQERPHPLPGYLVQAGQGQERPHPLPGWPHVAPTHGPSSGPNPQQQQQQGQQWQQGQQQLWLQQQPEQQAESRAPKRAREDMPSGAWPPLPGPVGALTAGVAGAPARVGQQQQQGHVGPLSGGVGVAVAAGPDGSSRAMGGEDEGQSSGGLSGEGSLVATTSALLFPSPPLQLSQHPAPDPLHTSRLIEQHATASLQPPATASLQPPAPSAWFASSLLFSCVKSYEGPGIRTFDLHLPSDTLLFPRQEEAGDGSGSGSGSGSWIVRTGLMHPGPSYRIPLPRPAAGWGRINVWDIKYCAEQVWVTVCGV